MHRGNRTLRAGLREAIGVHLREERRSRGIKAKDLAQAIGVRADALSQMELGRQTIPAELLADWCRQLGISLQFSATGIEDAPESLPPDHARLFNALDPQHRQVVLETLESVARLAGIDHGEPSKK